MKSLNLFNAVCTSLFILFFNLTSVWNLQEERNVQSSIWLSNYIKQFGVYNFNFFTNLLNYEYQQLLNWALVSAADNGHAELITDLISHGAQLEANNYEAVRVAARKGQLKVANLFLRLYFTQIVFIILLNTSIIEGHAQIVKVLLDYFDMSDDTPDALIRFQAALRLASMRNKLDIVQLLLNWSRLGNMRYSIEYIESLLNFLYSDQETEESTPYNLSKMIDPQILQELKDHQKFLSQHI